MVRPGSMSEQVLQDAMQYPQHSTNNNSLKRKGTGKYMDKPAGQRRGIEVLRTYVLGWLGFLHPKHGWKLVKGNPVFIGNYRKSIIFLPRRNYKQHRDHHFAIIQVELINYVKNH